MIDIIFAVIDGNISITCIAHIIRLPMRTLFIVPNVPVELQNNYSIIILYNISIMYTFIFKVYIYWSAISAFSASHFIVVDRLMILCWCSSPFRRFEYGIVNCV